MDSSDVEQSDALPERPNTVNARASQPNGSSLKNNPTHVGMPRRGPGQVADVARGGAHERSPGRIALLVLEGAARVAQVVVQLMVLQRRRLAGPQRALMPPLGRLKAMHKLQPLDPGNPE